MIALEVKKNGKLVCVAGAEDLSVLSAHVNACGKLGAKTVPARPDEESDFFYSVGGLTSRSNSEKDVHLTWKSVEALRIGDTIEVRIIETRKVDPAKSRRKAKRKD